MVSSSMTPAAGAWSQESIDGLSAAPASSAAAATASGGQCRWATHAGSAGSAAPSATARTRSASAALGADALLGQHRCGQGGGPPGHPVRPSGGQRSAPGPGGGLQGVQDDRGEGAQMAGSVDAAR
ncbi:hypothetical protein LUR56_18325 [Streptomyces sp. MT29]|nr:hypothetical protein [Streptomyces sp. MT29]